MTIEEISHLQKEETAKVAAKFEAARKIREALDAAEEIIGEDFDADAIWELVTE
jgi:predicted NAD-dependent protein-ADP-ribosyltransferase YbiA (DUF1768 family)